MNDNFRGQFEALAPCPNNVRWNPDWNGQGRYEPDNPLLNPEAAEDAFRQQQRWIGFCQGLELAQAGHTEQNPAAAAIEFALESGQSESEAMDFLRTWNEGGFDILREEWPEAPESIFIGADPSHSGTQCGSTNRLVQRIKAQAIADLRFPTALRKMWSGEEVQAWLTERAESITSDRD